MVLSAHTQPQHSTITRTCGVRVIKHHSLSSCQAHGITHVKTSRGYHPGALCRMNFMQVGCTSKEASPARVQLPGGGKLRPEAPLPEYREPRLRHSLSSHAPSRDTENHPSTFHGVNITTSEDESVSREPHQPSFEPTASTEEEGTIFSRASQVPLEVIKEFEHKLESDIQTAAATVFAVVGVITFQHGIWTGLVLCCIVEAVGLDSLSGLHTFALDRIFSNSFLGDVACAAVGLTMILWIRISGIKLAKFWPAS